MTIILYLLPRSRVWFEPAQNIISVNDNETGSAEKNEEHSHRTRQERTLMIGRLGPPAVSKFNRWSSHPSERCCPDSWSEWMAIHDDDLRDAKRSKNVRRIQRCISNHNRVKKPCLRCQIETRNLWTKFNNFRVTIAIITVHRSYSMYIYTNVYTFLLIIIILSN